MRSFPSLFKTSTLLKGLPKKLLTIGAAASVGMLAAASAMAAPVTYTIQAEGVASFNSASGGAGYYPGPMSIVMVGDTDNIGPAGTGLGSRIDLLSVTFNFGDWSLIGSPGVYALSTNGGKLELSSTDDQIGAASLIFDAADGVGYALDSAASAGPLAYGSNIQDGHFPTEDLNLTFSGLSNVSFQAVVTESTAVPEPDSLPLFAVAGAALFLAGKRRRQANAAA